MNDIKVHLDQEKLDYGMNILHQEYQIFLNKIYLDLWMKLSIKSRNNEI